MKLRVFWGRAYEVERKKKQQRREEGLKVAATNLKRKEMHTERERWRLQNLEDG